MGYPAVDAYLAQLPQGVASYPDACCKGLVLRQFLEGQPFGADLSGLPPPLAALMTKLPSSTAWVPEVHLTALVLARQAHLGQTDDELVAWSYTLNRKLLAQPLARLIMLVISPDALIASVSSRWGGFHQGTTLTLGTYGRGNARFLMTFREHLQPPVLLRCYATAFLAAIEVSGGKQVRCSLVESSTTSGVFEIAWSR